MTIILSGASSLQIKFGAVFLFHKILAITILTLFEGRQEKVM